LRNSRTNKKAPGGQGPKEAANEEAGKAPEKKAKAAETERMVEAEETADGMSAKAANATAKNGVQGGKRNNRKKRKMRAEAVCLL